MYNPTLRKSILCMFLSILFFPSFGQMNGPWNNPLKMSWSTDGVNFNAPTIFQDSSGVPSIIKWRGDTLIAAFQWFRQPQPSPSWDRVATKISYDKGITWSTPTPIQVIGLPTNFQRPFDPTLTVFNMDSLRIYFSTSDGFPVGGLDSTVDTYSAVSIDGIHFQFEPNPRVDEINNRVIDPAVIYFNNSWHYISPIGAPQDGAYHYVSPDAIHFMSVPNIPSNNTHNWTGNYMVESNFELRFYGCGSNIWYNSTSNGGIWNGYVNTNINGGDPSVVKIANNNYLMIYVGQPYATTTIENITTLYPIQIFPNPTKGKMNIQYEKENPTCHYTIFDNNGKPISTNKLQSKNTELPVDTYQGGIYYLQIEDFPNHLFPFIVN